MLPLPEKALSESMEKGGRKMQGKKKKRMKARIDYCMNGIKSLAAASFQKFHLMKLNCW